MHPARSGFRLPVGVRRLARPGLPAPDSLASGLLVSCLLVACLIAPPGVLAADGWQTLETADGSRPNARHEAGAVVVGDTLHLLGGRGRPPHETYSAAGGGWRDLGPLPLELNHFQPVVLEGKIVIVGAFTGNYPREESVAALHAYDLATGNWDVIGTMPAARVRGSTAALVREGKLYVIGGNTRGHDGGEVPWFDQYDPASDRWTVLPDAPHARDHFTAALVGDLLVAAGGRRSRQPNPAANPVLPTDVYDFARGVWRTEADIPTARAGTMTVSAGGEAIVVGGEINTSPTALDAVEAFDPVAGTWRALPALGTGRHGAGIGLIGDTLHVVAGASSLGGAKETRLHETLALELGETGSGSDAGTDSSSEERPDPDTDGPDTDDPDTEGPDTEGPDTEDPDTDDPDTEGPDTEGPDTDDPNTDDPNTDDPNTDDPNTEGPDTEGPDTEGPDTDGPDGESGDVIDGGDAPSPSSGDSGSRSGGGGAGGPALVLTLLLLHVRRGKYRGRTAGRD